MPTAIRLELVPYEQAIELFRAKKIYLPEIYYGADFTSDMRAFSFSTTLLSKIAQLEQIFESLDKAITNGESFFEWRKNLKVEDAVLPKHRLENIFRTNLQPAYSKGRADNISANKDTRPVLMYSAINDARTRPTHKAMNGYVAPTGSAVWNTWNPPCGYRCRCSLISLSPEQAKQRQSMDDEFLQNNPTAFAERKNALTNPENNGFGNTFMSSKIDDGLKQAAQKYKGGLFDAYLKDLFMPKV